ncbi:hypothetical protein AB0A63_31700 [Lentzea sp. NPDC042327]|uniref:hypothetical protein n=1 Tax=Lentzea sp. NPDC042327 TaxID=3154801 RepID=UPI0034032562
MLAEDAGARTRVLDVPVHQVMDGDRRLGSFRLQVYTGDGLRPVVIATQDATSEGCSLVNGAERYAASVWRTHFPERDEPPLWVQNMHAHHSTMLALVAFDAGPDYTLTAANWDVVNPVHLHRLVGSEVDLGRGERPAPAPKPVHRTKFVITPVTSLPPDKPFRAEKCMPPVRLRRWRHLLARLRPAPAPSTCCWYHRGDWRAANATALRLLATTPAISTDPDEWQFELAEAAHAEGLTGWQLEAVQSLFLAPIVLQHDENEGATWYDNGQHRGRAMRDAGVARTVTAVDELVEPGQLDNCK